MYLGHVQKTNNTQEPIATPFPEVHAYVLNKLGGRLDCVGDQGSYLKVFQSALHYYLNKRHKAKQKKRLFEKTAMFHWVYIFLLALRSVFQNKKLVKENIVIDPGRFLDNGESIFFSKIIQELGKENVQILVRRTSNPAYYFSSLAEGEGRKALPLGKVFRQWKDLRKVYQNAKLSGRWNDEELHYLDSSLHSYLLRYMSCMGSYDANSVKRVFFTVHYINEGFIAAMRDMGIKTIELQHGLISEADLYYTYSEDYRPWIKDAFFPDYLLMYGNIWFNRLRKGIEWKEGQLIVMGDYTHLFGTQERSAEKKNLILLCAQKFLSDQYVAWIPRIQEHLKHYPDWRMVVKLHPYEPVVDVPKYMALANAQTEIVQSGSLHDWFSKAKIQLSIYSTTFYDSIGYDVDNFALQNTGIYDSYVQEMLDAGVAVGIEEDEDPIAAYHSKRAEGRLINDRCEVYGNWDREKFRDYLASGKW
jgi:hypothetical protein